MALKKDLEDHVAKTFRGEWTTRAGEVVPVPDDLLLCSNDAIEFERATILYADLSGSTKLVDSKKWWFAAEVYKIFLHCAGKIINSEGGTIVSYDGDRVMAVFLGKTQTSTAARCGLKINYAVREIINPKLKARYSNTAYEVRQVVGIDTGEIRAARTGVRGGNDRRAGRHRRRHRHGARLLREHGRGKEQQTGAGCDGSFHPVVHTDLLGENAAPAGFPAAYSA